MRRSAFVALLFVAILAAACKPSNTGGFVVVTQGPASPDSGTATGNGAPDPSAASGSLVPVVISSQLAVGDNRFVFSFLDPKTQQPVGSPDLAASVAFIAPGTTDLGSPIPGTFVWAIQNLRGEYIAHATFPSAGDWKAVFIIQPKGASQQAIGIPFQVALKPTVVSIGDHAPASKTPTLADAGGDIRQISSDQHPDPAFYQVSADQAIARHTPFILVFATPAFCRSAQCGPTLDMVKQARASAPAMVAFINVEPYVLTYTDGRLQPVLDAQGNLTPTDVSNAWGLPTEPWVFAVDRNGIVQGSFEGVISQQELSDIIAKIAAS
jgi:hypothetical protein